MPQYTTQDKRLVSAYAEWLDQKSWSAFCTFTSYYGMSAFKASRSMDKLFEHLSINQNLNPEIFWVAEKFRSNQDHHIHALIKLDLASVSVTKLITNTWHSVCPPGGYKKHNRVHVSEYIPKLGAHAYVAKHLNKPDTLYGIL